MVRKPTTAWYTLADDDSYWDDRTTFGVVRCAEGDRAEFDRLAAALLSHIGEDPAGWTLDEPAWRWYRMNPDPSKEYSWLLTPASGPGRGNWMGAMVREAKA